MKNNNSLLTVIVAAGTAGVALFAIANSSLTAGLPFDSILATTVSIALLGFALKDYSPRFRPLALPVGRVVRPARSAGTTRPSPACGTGRVSSHSDHLAA